MGLEQLKQQLAEGKITQEEFNSEVAKLLSNGTITQEQHDEAIKTDSKKEDKQSFNINTLLEDESFKKQISSLVQSETDRVRTEYSKKLKDKEAELEELQDKHLTEEEKAKKKFEQQQLELEKKQAELLEKEVALHTTDQLKDKNLPLNFREILAGSSVEETDERINKFETEWNKAINEAVNKRFKDAGEDPEKGGSPSGEDNPWKAEHFNLTKQGEILKTDRAKAERLAKAAGKKLY